MGEIYCLRPWEELRRGAPCHTTWVMWVIPVMRIISVIRVMPVMWVISVMFVFLVIRAVSVILVLLAMSVMSIRVINILLIWVARVISVSTNNHMFGKANWDKLPECIFGNFEIFKNHEGKLCQKSPETNMWLLVNRTKPPNTWYWN